MSAALAPVRLPEILRSARLCGASDIHLAEGREPVLRIDGTLHFQPTPVVSAEEIEHVVACVFDDRTLEVLRLEGDATSTYRDDELGIFRVHAYRSLRGVSLAIRLLSRGVPALESLHLPPAIAELAERSAGLILFTGPTGSGKSTAMAAVIDRINRTQARHILTLEDPIEYEHRPVRSTITQRQIGRDVADYASAIHGALRSDPDVLLVGELRDPAAMQAALTAAETGHLVLATLHTGDAAQSIDRIVSVFAGDAQEQIRMQLAQTLCAAVSLRLVPRASGQGRRSAAEVMMCSDAIRSLIREAKTHQIRNVVMTGRQSGMQTLEAHLSELVARREIDVETARRVSDRPHEIRSSGRDA